MLPISNFFLQYQNDVQVLELSDFEQSVNHEINSSSNGILVKLENNVTSSLSKIKQFPLLKGFGNHLILDKTCEKLFSNFTNQHLITHTNSNNG